MGNLRASKVAALIMMIGFCMNEANPDCALGILLKSRAKRGNRAAAMSKFTIHATFEGEHPKRVAFTL